MGVVRLRLLAGNVRPILPTSHGLRFIYVRHVRRQVCREVCQCFLQCVRHVKEGCSIGYRVTSPIYCNRVRGLHVLQGYKMVPFFRQSLRWLFRGSPLFKSATFVPRDALFFCRLLAALVDGVGHGNVTTVNVQFDSYRLNGNVYDRVSRDLSPKVYRVFVFCYGAREVGPQGLGRDLRGAYPRGWFPNTTRTTMLAIGIGRRRILFCAMVRLCSFEGRASPILQVYLLTIRPLRRVLGRVIYDYLLQEMTFLLGLDFVETSVMRVVFNVLFAQVFVCLREAPNHGST